MGLNLIDRSGLELLFFSLSLSISISFYVISFSFSFFCVGEGGGVVFSSTIRWPRPLRASHWPMKSHPERKKENETAGRFSLKFFFHFWFLFPFPFRLVRCVFFRIFFLPSFTGFKGFYLFFSKERLN